jgi:hypothetical protein
MVNESRAVGQQAELFLSPTVGIGSDRSWEGGGNAGKPHAKRELRKKIFLLCFIILYICMYVCMYVYV